MDTAVACILLNVSENQVDFILCPSCVTQKHNTILSKAVSELELASFKLIFVAHKLALCVDVHHYL